MRPLPHSAPEGFRWLTRVARVHPIAQGALLEVDASDGEIAQIRLETVGEGIWQCAVIPAGEVEPPATGMLIPHTALTATADVRLDERTLSLSDRASTLRVDRDPWYLRLEDNGGTEVFRENPGDVDGLGRPFVLPLGFVREGGIVRTVSFSFHLDPDEHLFGLGEKFLPLNRRGQRIVAWTQDAFGSTSERSHKNIPLLISSKGYGLFLDTGARIVWDLGTMSCQSCTVVAEASALRFFLMQGPTPSDVLQRYVSLAGAAPIPPRWTFGLWVSSGGTYRDQKTMEQLIAGLEEHRIAADVVHVDPWWMKWRKYCDFVWNTDAFPDPAGFIRDLHDRGFRLCLWEHPYISAESELFAIGKEKGFFLRKSNGDVYVIDYGLSLAPRPDGIVRTATPETSWNARVAIVDVTNPDAVQWFQDLHRSILRMGVDVFKTDFGEDVPADATFHNGQTGRTMHNLYPLLYNEAVSAVTLQERGHGVVWGRAGTGGSHRVPICWSGDPAADFESLACTIRGGLSIGMSGVPFWSNDIGGYRGTPDPTLYVRWAQFGLFCSHSRMHGDSPREPWVFGDEALRIVRRYVDMRYQLFPYLYSTAMEAHDTGMPVIRALALMWPDDPHALETDQQYMLGPWLMVAPVVHRSGQKFVYLPEGCWIDYWTGERIVGPRTLHLQVPLDLLPLYVREGAIIPTMGSTRRIPEGAIDPLILDLYPSSSPSSYRLREDGATTTLRLAQERGNVRIQWDGSLVRKWVFRLHQPGKMPDECIEREGPAADRGEITLPGLKSDKEH